MPFSSELGVNAARHCWTNFCLEPLSSFLTSNGYNQQGSRPKCPWSQSERQSIKLFDTSAAAILAVYDISWGENAALAIFWQAIFWRPHLAWGALLDTYVQTAGTVPIEPSFYSHLALWSFRSKLWSTGPAQHWYTCPEHWRLPKNQSYHVDQPYGSICILCFSFN